MKINEFIDSLKIKEIDDDMRDLGLDGPDSADDDDCLLYTSPSPRDRG